MNIRCQVTEFRSPEKSAVQKCIEWNPGSQKFVRSHRGQSELLTGSVAAMRAVRQANRRKSRLLS